MPNTKSAQRRMRNSARKQLHNRSIKSRLHTLENSYLELLGAGKKEPEIFARPGRTVQEQMFDIDCRHEGEVGFYPPASRSQTRVSSPG